MTIVLYKRTCILYDTEIVLDVITWLQINTVNNSLFFIIDQLYAFNKRFYHSHSIMMGWHDKHEQ